MQNMWVDFKIMLFVLGTKTEVIQSNSVIQYNSRTFPKFKF